MKDFYSNTRQIIDEYNQILDKIISSPEPTTDEEDEKLQNHCLYLAHALIKDMGGGNDTIKLSEILKAVCR